MLTLKMIVISEQELLLNILVFFFFFNFFFNGEGMMMNMKSCNFDNDIYINTTYKSICLVRI